MTFFSIQVWVSAILGSRNLLRPWGSRDFGAERLSQWGYPKSGWLIRANQCTLLNIDQPLKLGWLGVPPWRYESPPPKSDCTTRKKLIECEQANAINLPWLVMTSGHGIPQVGGNVHVALGKSTAWPLVQGCSIFGTHRLWQRMGRYGWYGSLRPSTHQLGSKHAAKLRSCAIALPGFAHQLAILTYLDGFPVISMQKCPAFCRVHGTYWHMVWDFCLRHKHRTGKSVKVLSTIRWPSCSQL